MFKPQSPVILETKDYKNWEITDNYQDLIYHDEPILFSGKNSDDKYIVGSSVEYDEGINAYFYSVVPDFYYRAFMSGEISYLKVLEKARNIFLVHYLDKPEALRIVYSIKFEDIPADYLPSDKAIFRQTETK